MIEYQIHGSFICEKCRQYCNGDCHSKLTGITNGEIKPGTEEYEKNKDLIGRKQIIRCLGPFCDDPCSLQLSKYTPYNEEDGVKPLIELIKWMGQKLNNCIENLKVDIVNKIMEEKYIE